MPNLLIQFNGANAATSYTAETGQTLTFVGNAQLSTAAKKFGPSSLLLDGTGDYVSVPDSADWNFGTGDFTIDFWINWDNIAKFGHIIGQYQDSDNCWQLYTYTDSMLYFANVSGGTTSSSFGIDLSGLSTGTWYHIAFVRNGSTTLIFINGVSQSVTTYAAWGTMPDRAEALMIGGNTQGTRDTDGYIDELRVTKGTALWTADFTPPVMPLSLSHYKCNDDAASTAVTDDGAGANAGTATNNTATISTTGIISKAFNFNGSSEYITANGLGVAAALGSLGSLTLWLRCEEAGFRVPITFGDNNVATTYIFLAFNTNNIAALCRLSGTNQWSCSSSTTTLTNTWYHVALVHDGTTPILYVNAVDTSAAFDVTTDKTKWLNMGGIDAFSIGARVVNSSPNNYFLGDVDDVRYYRNIVLSLQDIKNIFRAGLGTEDDPPTLWTSKARNQGIIIT